MEYWMLFKRMSIYNEMVNNQELPSSHFCNHNLDFLEAGYKDKFKTTIATMSHRLATAKLIKILGVKDKLDLILTYEDVTKGKTNPEIYLQAMKK